MSRLRKRFFDCQGLTFAEAEGNGGPLAEFQRDVMFWIGDLARYAEARWPETWHQVFPEWISPGLLARATGVCKAYPTEEDRRHEATYSQYLQVAGKPDRHELLAGFVAQGLTTDESRKAAKAAKAASRPEDGRQRWLLAIDVNYFLHRFWHSGAGVEAATGVAAWISRTTERLKDMGLTDVACCFDDRENHRKALTADWPDKYKDRPPKDPELTQQLILVRELLEKAGFAVVRIDGMEADDVMASYAKQFPGRVTLVTQDKDARQCLSPTCNILLDVEWREDDTSGDMLPVYKWLSAKQHTEATGLRPDQWPDFQTIAGDAVDGIRGVEGIGQKGAADLVKDFGSVEAAIEAAKAADERIRPKKREALIAFESKLEITRKLVTLRDDLTVPSSTRI